VSDDIEGSGGPPDEGGQKRGGKARGRRGDAGSGGKPRAKPPMGRSGDWKPSPGKPHGPRAHPGKPYGSKTPGGKPYGPKAHEGRSYGSRPRPFGPASPAHGAGGWRRSDRDYGDRSHGDRSHGERAYGERAYGERPDREREAGEWSPPAHDRGRPEGRSRPKEWRKPSPGHGPGHGPGYGPGHGPGHGPDRGLSDRPRFGDVRPSRGQAPRPRRAGFGFGSAEAEPPVRPVGPVQPAPQPEPDRRRRGPRQPRGFERRDETRPWARPQAAPPAPPAESLLAEDEELVAGRHPVEEAFVAHRQARRLLVVPQRRQALEKLVLHAVNLRLPIVEVEGGTLTALAGFDGHQGIALVTDRRRYAGLEELLARAIERHEPPFVLVLDSLEDPQNFGSLLRTAEASGVHGVVFPTHRQAPLSAAAVKASAGAVEHLLLAPVDDLAAALADLHVRGLRVVGTDAEAPLTARQTDLRGPAAIVVGSEGQGLGPAVRHRCDALVRIPMRGHVGSLNAAVAGSILLYEAASQRGGEPALLEPEPAPAEPPAAELPAAEPAAAEPPAAEPATAQAPKRRKRAPSRAHAQAEPAAQVAADDELLPGGPDADPAPAP
jgi:23S rRNA (guanosine2251-2'-O)-methyltransferase